jgi:putative flippase GtrA
MLHVRDKILDCIDFFHPPFRKIMPIKTFRYAACGGANVLFGNVVVYTLIYHLVKYRDAVSIGLFAFKPYNFALTISSVFTFCVGFILNKYVVFTTSNLKASVQLFRYFLAFLFSYSLNYLLLNKVFIEGLHLNPVISQGITVVIVTAVSYLTQMHFTFKVKKDAEDITQLPD